MSDLDILTLWRTLGRADDFLQTIPDARRGPSPLQGLGMFSSRPRAAGELVCVLDGQVVDSRKYPEIMHALEWNALSERLLLVRPLRTSYGYVNHARSPNLVIEPDGRTMRVVRAIAADEELTLDYLAPPVPPAYLDSEEGRRLRSLAAGPPA